MSVASIPNKLKSEISEDRNGNDRVTFWGRFVRNNRNDLQDYFFWRAALGEFLGTLLLAFFTIGFGLRPEGTEPPSLLMVAISCGFFLAVIISSLTTVSGGHVNPAISIGFLVANKITMSRFVVYSVFQTIGGITGAALLKAVVPSSYVGRLGLIMPSGDTSDGCAFAMEVIITFNLLFITMAMVDDGRVDVQGSIPFVVGMTVVVNIVVSASVSGGCMNPIRAFASAVMTEEMGHVWIYWLGPLLGGFLGALIYHGIFSTKPWISVSSFHGKHDDYDQVKLQEITDHTTDNHEMKA